jgi:hypothetical protein
MPFGPQFVFAAYAADLPDVPERGIAAEETRKRKIKNLQNSKVRLLTSEAI